jgi:hypothetical protein
MELVLAPSWLTQYPIDFPPQQSDAHFTGGVSRRECRKLADRLALADGIAHEGSHAAAPRTQAVGSA